MTAEAFDRLLYTDCRAGTGRGAGGGFQVQAQSSGVDAAQSRMAVGWLLYEAQNAWIVQRRPVDDFPPGFAHACAAGYGTAQSRYVGQEATGGRQGNHLADCILTRDPDLYGSTRPAQLWRSELWRGVPWPGTDCPQLDGEPPLGPLTVDAIADWLQDRPQRAPVLERLLSILEDPAGRRVVMVAASPDEALTWIAAATLLLPVRLALEISVKVFCVNPLRAEQRIVAVPQELSAQVAAGGAGSAFVLHAGGCTSDDAEVSHRARFLVGQLASTDDPYDVVDAVELAESLGAAGKPGGADAMVTAWAVTQPSSPLSDPAALVRWLSDAGPQLQREHGTPVARRILDAGPPADVLRFLDAAVAAGRISLDPAEVRGRLLSAEVAEAGGATGAPPAMLAPVALHAHARRDADSELSSAILLGSDTQVDVLLRLACRHGIELGLPPLRKRLHDFVLHWLDDDAAAFDPRSWAHGAEILDLAGDELRARLGAGGAAGVLRPLGRLYPYFAGRPDDPTDPTDPLDPYLKVAAIATTPGQQRPPELRALLERIMESPDHGRAVTDVQRALLAWDAIGPAEAIVVLTCLPESTAVEPEIAEIVSAELRRRAGSPDERLLDLLGRLDRRGQAPATDPLRGLRDADRDVQSFIEITREGRFLFGASYARKVAALGQVDPAVIGVRLGPILAACLECPHPDLGSMLLRAIAPGQRMPLLRLWGDQLRGEHRVSAAVWAVGWIQGPDLAPKPRGMVIKAVQKFGSGLSPAVRERWFLDVQSRLLPDQTEDWADLCGYGPPKTRRGLHIRDRDG
jgi:hypothetical protein